MHMYIHYYTKVLHQMYILQYVTVGSSGGVRWHRDDGPLSIPSPSTHTTQGERGRDGERREGGRGRERGREREGERREERGREGEREGECGYIMCSCWL